MKRRDFIWQAGALAAGGLLLPACSSDNKSNVNETTDKTEGVSQTPAPPMQALPIGLQLYTVRELLEKDLKGTLQKIADIGFKDLESAMGQKGHYYGMKPKEFTSMLDGMGMKLRSSHVLMGTQTKEEAPLPDSVMTLTNSLQKLVDMAAEAGQQYLTCAFLFPSEHKTINQYKKHIELFNRAGEACQKAGLKFAYHNHDFEFEKIDGQVPYDLILSETDPEKVKLELDLYWVAKAGLNHLELFQKNPGRFAMWHVKDMDKTEKKFFTEVGNGSIDFKSIFAAAKTSGMEYYFVEQDQTPGDPIASITTSYANLSKILA